MPSVDCPHCRKKITVPEFTAITPDSPELKALFAGTFDSVVCPACHQRFSLDRPLIYRDSTAEPAYILYCMEPPEDGNTEELENQIDGMATDCSIEKDLARPIVRLVFSRPDFLEKIAIHQMGLDDRLVEYAKLTLFRNLEEPHLSRTLHRLLLDWSHCDEQHMHFLVFDRETQRHINVIQIPTAEFNTLVRNATEDEQIQLELEAAFPGCYVSADRLL